MTKPWWHGSVGYEVYIRSFADADGDGVGDLRGLHQRLDHLAWLGVDLLWVTPFYPSPMHDHGYDVADYTGVDERFGTLDDLDAVLEEAHARGMRVVIDLVPNHTSSEHPWFAESASSRDNPYRDYYIWRDPGPDGGPPNNWVSVFGGPAWTYDEATGQYWLHLFLPEQPDLNWANPAVAEEFDRILEFWLNRGVDGFRIDVAHGLVKHPELLDLPLIPESERVETDQFVGDYALFDHVYDRNQPGVLEVYRRWRKLVDTHDALLLGEVYLREVRQLAPYVKGRDGLHMTFWFSPVHVPWDAERLRDVLVEGLTLVPGSVAWISGSHDRSRVVTRFGGGDVGRARALAFATLLFGLPGVPFLYQGEELGLDDVPIDATEAQDPIGARAGALDRSRDVCRTPMPWRPGAGMGFTTASAEPWLPFGDRRPDDTVQGQRDDPTSLLHRYRALIGLRRGMPDVIDAPVEWLTAGGPVLAYRRGDVLVAGNCGEAVQRLTLPDGGWRVAFDADGGPERAVAGLIVLEPAQAVVLTAQPAEAA